MSTHRKKMFQGNNLLLPSLRKSRATISSVLESKQELEEILSKVDKSEFNHNDKTKIICESLNRQINSAMIVDWKQLREGEKRQAELSLKDGQNGERLIFEVFVEQWQQGSPSKVIYKWKRIPRESEDNLQQEEHLYRGPILAQRKHGDGEYIITRRFKDGKQFVKAIKGTWKHNILERGIITDEEGNQKSIDNHIFIKKSSNKPQIHHNKTILEHSQQISQKRVSFVNKNQPGSKQSLVSILDKNV